MTAQFCRNLTHFVGTELMIFRGAVREVHTYYVCARGDNLSRLLSRSVAGPKVVTILVLRSLLDM